MGPAGAMLILFALHSAQAVEYDLHVTVEAQETSDAKLLAKLAAQLRDKDDPDHTSALKQLAQLLAASKGAKADFSPVIEPLFDHCGWGGKARDNARLAEELMVRIGRPALPLVKQRLTSEDAHDRRVAVELLMRIGPPDAALADLVKPLLADRDEYVRQAATHGLGVVGPLAKEAIGDLERVATDDPVLQGRVGARIALIRVAGPSQERVRALAAFLEMKDKVEGPKGSFQSAKDAAVYAASALGGLGPKARIAEPQLLAALKQPALRNTAAYALGQIGANSPEAVAALIDLLKNDPEREARRSAAAALGALGPAAKPAIPALRAALQGDGKGGWWVVADALGKIGGAEVVPVLIEALENPDDDVRRTATRALGNLGALARPALTALEKVRADDPREINRTAAAEALRKIEKAGKN